MNTVNTENKQKTLNPLHTYFSTKDFFAEDIYKIDNKEVQLFIDNYSIIDYTFPDKVIHCIIMRDVKIMQTNLNNYILINVLPCLIDEKGIRKLRKHNGRNPVCINAKARVTIHYNIETKEKDIISVCFDNWDYIDENTINMSA